MNETMIKIKGLSKQYRYGQIGFTTLQSSLKNWWENRKSGQPSRPSDSAPEFFYALEDINVEIASGEKVGIIGKNGAGKSTLLKLISRITSPTDGSIELSGRVASLLEVGTGFDGELTGRENIYLNGSILGMSRNEIDSKMDDIIAFSGVGNFIDTPVKRYSSGMRVKLGFSVAAHLDNEILIMDEVLAVGDMEYQKKCIDRMRSLADSDNRTILYVSHNMNTIKALCTRCLVLDQGHLIYDGNVDQAISIYLGLDRTLPDEYVFNADYRPYDRSLRANKRFEIKSLRFSEHSSQIVSNREPINVVLSVESLKHFDRVGFRLELWFHDGSKIGTMLSRNFVSLDPGDATVHLSIDPAHLTNGQYRADLIAYQFDQNGTEDILDGVYPGLIFHINNRLDEENYLDWNHQYWGAVRLHDLTVK